jgi:magnesium chelatase family protein
MPGKKITINMAPADCKEGSAYDLTLTIGILVASGQIKAEDVDKYIIMGNFGSLQPIRGAYLYAKKPKKKVLKVFFFQSKM